MAPVGCCVLQCAGPWWQADTLLVHAKGLILHCSWSLNPTSSVQGLLSKYDEEEEEGGLKIGAAGVVADAKSRQQAEIRRKLAEGVRCSSFSSQSPGHECLRRIEPNNPLCFGPQSPGLTMQPTAG